jgi:hypothetical protein
MQFVQFEPALEYFPALHDTQAVATVLPPGDDDPAVQFVHVEPTREYVPAGHDTQLFMVVLPVGPVDPA